ncbi:MAG: hypothetical protein HW403_1248 [Dehalococcoidia bacterium]|nr:hypothetical protein [Dehalococcoidia bacterium]
MMGNKRLAAMLKDPLMNRKVKVGTFFETITVANLRTGRSVTLDALVDTGATLTSIPISLLGSIGVEPADSWDFELADGSHVQQDVRHILVTVEGRATPTLCTFAPEGSAPLLGVVVLESVGFTVDPMNMKLVPAIRPR